MANGVLGLIAQPAQADIGGALEVGRSRKARNLAGDILGNTFTGKLGALAQVDPDIALKLSKEFGIPLSAKGRFDSFVGSAIAGNQLLQAGLTQEAGQFLIEQADQVEAALTQPGVASRTRQMGERILAGDPEAAEQLGAFAAQLTKPNAEQVQKRVNTLRTTADKFSKEFRTVEDAFARIKAVADNPSGAGDLALIFNFMKMLDPGSTVRESEFATAQNAAGVPELIRNRWNRVFNGERLGVETRKDFLNQTTSLFNAQQEVNDQRINAVLQRGVQDQISGTQIFGRERLDAFNRRQEARDTGVQAPAGFGPGNKPIGELTTQELNTLSIEELQRAREALATQEGG